MSIDITLDKSINSVRYIFINYNMKKSIVDQGVGTPTLGIPISAGHALGDHAEYEIKYSNLIDNIKKRNKIFE